MYNVLKFQAPFERIKQYGSPEENLIKAIIMQGITDASNTTNSPATLKQTIAARNWLFGGEGHEYFILLCHVVGLDPFFIMKVARETIKEHKSNKNIDTEQDGTHKKPQDISKKIPKLLALNAIMI